MHRSTPAAVAILLCALCLAILLAPSALARGNGNPGGLVPPDVDIVAEEVGALSARVDDLEKVLQALPKKVVFVTSHSFTGNLGGLDGADALCQAAALDAGLPGRFLAWLSTAGSGLGAPEAGPLHRFTRHAVPYVRTDGVKVADHFGDLVDGTLDAPIDRTEFASQLFAGNTTWSSTLANGAPTGGGNPRLTTCDEWTSDAVLTQAFSLGTVGATDFTWSAPVLSVGTPCTSPQRLLCVEQ